MEAEHDRVELPEPPATLVDERVHDKLVELVIEARVTVPVKPLTDATVTVDGPATPVFTEILTGLAEIAKSWTWNATVAE
jgi:hypothetical protein